jgi:leucyl-tRNA synthetase
MDTFVDSSWYFLRYLTPRKEDGAFDPELVRAWLPVHQYVGGIEHAAMHLVYARFFTMVLHDLGLIAVDEPFERLFCQGMVCSTAYRADYYRTEAGEPIREDDVRRLPDGSTVRRADGKPVALERLYLPVDEVDTEKLVRKSDGWPVQTEMAKMSKSKFNGVSPDELFEKFGADTVHTYILFVGPADQDNVYSDDGVVGIHRFLNRFWDLVAGWADRLSSQSSSSSSSSPTPLDPHSKALRRKAHQTLQRVTEAFDLPFRFNTAIAGIMELTNELRDRAPLPPSSSFPLPQGEGAEGRAAALREALTIAVRCLSPFAPHVCEELWERLGNAPSIFRSPWPAYDPAAAKAEEVEIPIQVNGKLRSKITVPADSDEAAIQAAALADDKVKGHLEGKTVRRIVVVPGRLVNVVVA